MDFAGALTLVQTLLQLIDFSSPIRREIESIWGYKSQLKKLEDTIFTIQSVLLEAERQQSRQLQLSFPLQASLERLNKVLYDADDLFDEVATLAQRKKLMSGNTITKEVSLFFSRFNQLIYAFTKYREIKNIRETLDDITRDHSEIGNMMPQQVGWQTNPRETGSLVYEEDVIIGREDDKRALIDMLVHSAVEESVSCVSIVGIGGLGKTTLAQLVYNDERIIKEFQLKMWVCVSNDFDGKALLGEILAAATNQPKQRGLSLDQLQTRIQQELVGKKYLLVLDDVWDDFTRKWDEIIKPLICDGSRGSRILMTARSGNMGDTVGGQTHELKGLSEAESWNLFERMTLKSRQEMEVLNGGKILKKCAAVPLAIRVIGRLLRGQGKNKWMHLGNTDLANESNEDIVPVLKISYYDLPLHLKRCFSYCAVFPKDYKIVKEDLISLWMAQGFINANGCSLEDVGEEYFMNLLERCFFQDVNRSADGDIISCKMHDLIHDVAKNIVGTETMLVKYNTSNSLKAEVCHVFMEYEVVERGDTIRFCTQMKRMRTLLNSHHPYFTTRSVCDFEISKVKNLRVLSWPLFHIKKVPSSIGDLMHLRYLDLSFNDFRLLPPSITNLFNLQTLKLRRCYFLENLPKNLMKLVKLRCLDLFDCNGLRNMPPGMRNMTSLHKLTRFVLGNNKRNKDNFSRRARISGLKDLKCLKSLSGNLKIIIRGDSTYNAAEVRDGGYISDMQLKGIVIQFDYFEEYNNAEVLLEGLQPNHNLRTLELIDYPGLRFPSWGVRDGLKNNLKSYLPHIVEISFYKCFKLENLPLMSQCPKLKFLHLENLSNLEYVECNSIVDGNPTELEGSRLLEVDELVFFPSLQSLKLVNLPKLKGWVLHLNSYEFPQLKKLTIESCDKLTTFPLCPKGGAFRIAVCNDSSELLSFNDQSGGRVEVNSVNVGYIINSLPAGILQHLPYLVIHNCNNVKRLLTGEVFQTGCVPSLISLQIRNCKELKRLSELGQIRRYLTALETLQLIRLPELELDCEDDDNKQSSSRECKTVEEEIREEDNNTTAFDMPWRLLALTLCRLRLKHLPKLVKLPRGMHCLTSLHSLEICQCYNLEELPAWITCFSSIRSLDIDSCEKLKSLPQEMCHLTSLQHLTIFTTSKEFEKRCEKPNGSDWLKIMHIPYININGKVTRAL